MNGQRPPHRVMVGATLAVALAHGRHAAVALGAGLSAMALVSQPGTSKGIWQAAFEPGMVPGLYNDPLQQR